MSSVIAVIVTHRRPEELQRLLNGLAASKMSLAGCVISDHAPDGTTRKLAGQMPFDTQVLDDPSNPGPGAGWANAVRDALARFPDLNAIWYLDDDVVIAPSTLETLWCEMQRAQAAAIAPLLEDSKGHLWAFPEPVDRIARRQIRQARSPEEARQLLGDEPLPFCWCTGACFLVGRSALDATPLHRTDFWMLGEDLEYSMRIAAGNHAVFTCRVSVPHLPPEKEKKLLPATDANHRPDVQGPQSAPENGRESAGDRSGPLKFCALLQNLSYLTFHSKESRHMKWYLPGNFRRFFRTYGYGPFTFQNAFHCFWFGAVRGQPAGRRSGQTLRQRISRTTCTDRFSH